MIIELKWNKDADAAIRQIKERRCAGALASYKGDILLVGISCSKRSKTKKHTCVIERFRNGSEETEKLFGI